MTSLSADIHLKFFPQAQPIVRGVPGEAAILPPPTVEEDDDRFVALLPSRPGDGSRPQAIIEHVCNKHGMTKAQLLGLGRPRPWVDARQEAVLLMRNVLGLTTTQIGRILNRDHTSIVHLLKRAKQGEKA